MSNILSKTLNIFKNVRNTDENKDVIENKSTNVVLYTRFTPGGKTALSSFPDGDELRFVHVDHSEVGPEQNFIEIARKDAQAKDIVVALANRGFMAYALREGTTSFVHHQRLPTLWNKVKDGDFKVDQNGLIYSLQSPLNDHPVKHLLVVFSSMAGKIYTASMMRHFEQNFSTAQKYMPAGTAVLRIADLGGVVGGWYMNTHALPDNEAHIQALIARIIDRAGISREDTVFYGVSKGGSAALYHGLLGKYRVVAIDPILADEHYVKMHRDSHFTIGVFPKDKLDKFRELSAAIDPERIAPTAIICSQRSPQFPYITSVLGKALNDRIAFFNSLNPDIKLHPDVSPKTLNVAVMAMNMLFYRMPMPAGMHVVDNIDGVDPQARDVITRAEAAIREPAPKSEADRNAWQVKLAGLQQELQPWLASAPCRLEATWCMALLAEGRKNNPEALIHWKDLLAWIDDGGLPAPNSRRAAYRVDAIVGIARLLRVKGLKGDIQEAKRLISPLKDEDRGVNSSVATERKRILAIESRLTSIEKTKRIRDSVKSGREVSEVIPVISACLREAGQPDLYQHDELETLICSAYQTALRFPKAGPIDGLITDPYLNYRKYHSERPGNGAAKLVFAAGFGWSGSGAVVDFLCSHEGGNLGGCGRELALFRGTTGFPSLTSIFDGVRGTVDPQTFMEFLLGPAVLGLYLPEVNAAGWRNKSLFKANLDAKNDRSALMRACDDLLRDLSDVTGDDPQRTYDQVMWSLATFAGNGLRALGPKDSQCVIFSNCIPCHNMRNIALFPGATNIVVRRDPRDQFVARYYEAPVNDVLSADAFIDLLQTRYHDLERVVNALDLRDRIMEVRFEDFILDSSVREKILLDLHIDPVKRPGASVFDASASSKNVGIYKNFPDQSAIKKIANTFPEYLHRGL